MGTESVLMPEKASEDETQNHQRGRQKNDLREGATTQSTLGKNNRKRNRATVTEEATYTLMCRLTVMAHTCTHTHTSTYSHEYKHNQDTG